MKKLIKTSAFLLAVSIGLMVGFQVPSLQGETIKKLHTDAQKMWDDQDINDSTDGTSNPSTTIDLDGGNLDKCSFCVYVTSGATGGTPTLDMTFQISPDGGTTWIDNSTGTFTQITTTSTASTECMQDIPVNPGTKARYYPTLADSTTFYSITLWGMCSVD